MAIKTPDIPRPDHTRVGVGNQGDVVNQEEDSGKQVIRRGAGSSQADLDVATVDEPHDLASGDYESGQRSTGGAEAIAGGIVSADSQDFTITVDWLDDDGNVLSTHAPSALDTVNDVDFNIIARSDHFEVTITDVSGAGQNRINGSINAH